jgi:hypothetical protein
LSGDEQRKQLRVATVPIPGSDQTELELMWGTHELGSLTVHPDDLVEFIEALRFGFDVVISTEPTRQAAERQRQRDIAQFLSALPEQDERHEGQVSEGERETDGTHDGDRIGSDSPGYPSK